MSDFIATLPVDNEPIPPDENRLLEQILSPNSFRFQAFLNDLKIPLLAGFIFLIISNSTVRKFISDTIPYAKSSETSLSIVQGFIIVIILYLINNLSSVMKS